MNDERGEEWGMIIDIYRNNKGNRSINNIEEQNILEEQKKREGSRRQKLREDRRRQISEEKKIKEKHAEELKGSRRDSKGREKTEQNSRIKIKKTTVF